jgi:hypothetical protein
MFLSTVGCAGPTDRLADKLKGLVAPLHSFCCADILFCYRLNEVLCTVCCAGPTGQLADKLKGLDNDGLVAALQMMLR